MIIRRDNYEVYFLDYLEGNLDEKLVDDFLDFLRQNPDLKAELEMTAPVQIEMENIDFKLKEKLYKEKYDLESEFNRAAVAKMEGYLPKKEKKELKNYLSKHPEKQKEALLFEKTRLKADDTILFQKKSKLYHHSVGKTILLWSARIAAALVLAFLVFRAANNFSTQNDLSENQVVVTENKTHKEPEETTGIPNEPEYDLMPVERNLTKPVKKAAPKTETEKNLRETTRDRMDKERIAEVRIPVEIPKMLTGREALLVIEQPEGTLAQMKIALPKTPAGIYEERLLADVVKEKTGLGNFSVNSLAKVGLNLISNLSGKKFCFETNTKGHITELNYDSRLLAFSIPTKHD